MSNFQKIVAVRNHPSHCAAGIASAILSVYTTKRRYQTVILQFRRNGMLGRFLLQSLYSAGSCAGGRGVIPAAFATLRPAQKCAVRPMPRLVFLMDLASKLSLRLERWTKPNPWMESVRL